MATRESFVFVFFMLISPFYPISGNSVRYQKIKDYLVHLCQLYEKILTLWLSTKARVKQMDKFTSESMKAQETQPDIIIIQKESVEAPFGSYTPQAVQESNEVVSKILSDLQPSKPVLWKQLMWQRKKRWTHNKRGKKPSNKRRGRFRKHLERSPKPRFADRQDWIPRRFKRHECRIRNIQNSEDEIQKAIEQKENLRCVRSTYVDEKESKSQATSTHSNERKRRKANEVITYNVKEGQLLGLKGRRTRRRRSTYPGKPHLVSSKPFDSYSSSYSLSSYFTPSSSQSTLSRRMKRNVSSFHKKEGSFEDTFLINTKEQKIRERKMGAFPKKREARETQSVRNVSLKLKTLKSQEKLSNMVDRLSDPSNNMSKDEKLTYMHELLDELKLFIKLLEQQILLQSLNNIVYSTTVSGSQK
ncbi:uncharacterized protein LOC128404090 isoform X4 [Podarcis raffonei]|uniref:uncharacterized protein LOC128404090 isoform X4 n=1 Tax=Podarcis raffonei TaxID=65483 RepID=UPI0023298566|nr:uncharacterized protein LOC128404090 isoform X4 [Podarcis raffonei]XP_053225369.1 uncharacterized protein LOC128404090 isoform X4 [Podarcis raffonei]XP_053225370.1 uncharacterized protein LOC128404090 isoform X4 [Podarcis raffonei]